MASERNGVKAKLLDKMLRDASWLASHAEGLTDFGHKDEAEAEWLRAAACAEQVACLLEAENRDTEAAVQRIAAASCFQRIEQYTRAVTLLHAALAFPLVKAYRRKIEKQLKECLTLAKKQLNRQARKKQTAVA